MLWYAGRCGTYRVTPKGGGHDRLRKVRLHVVTVATQGVPCTGKPCVTTTPVSKKTAGDSDAATATSWEPNAYGQHCTSAEG